MGPRVWWRVLKYNTTNFIQKRNNWETGVHQNEKHPAALLFLGHLLICMRLGAADKKLDDRSTSIDFMAAAEIQNRAQESLENLIC